MNIAIRTGDYNDCHFAMDSNGKSAMQIKDIDNPYTSSINVFVPYEEWDCLSGCISLAAEIGKHYEMSYPEICINWVGPWWRKVAGVYAFEINNLGQPRDWRDPERPDEVPKLTPNVYYEEYKKTGNIPFPISVTFKDSIKPIEEDPIDLNKTTPDPDIKEVDVEIEGDLKVGIVDEITTCPHCGKDFILFRRYIEDK